MLEAREAVFLALFGRHVRIACTARACSDAHRCALAPNSLYLCLYTRRRESLQIQAHDYCGSSKKVMPTGRWLGYMHCVGGLKMVGAAAEDATKLGKKSLAGTAVWNTADIKVSSRGGMQAACWELCVEGGKVGAKHVQGRVTKGGGEQRIGGTG